MLERLHFVVGDCVGELSDSVMVGLVKTATALYVALN